MNVIVHNIMAARGSMVSIIFRTPKFEDIEFRIFLSVFDDKFADVLIILIIQQPCWDMCS